MRGKVVAAFDWMDQDVTRHQRIIALTPLGGVRESQLSLHGSLGGIKVVHMREVLVLSVIKILDSV